MLGWITRENGCDYEATHKEHGLGHGMVFEEVVENCVAHCEELGLERDIVSSQARI